MLFQPSGEEGVAKREAGPAPPSSSERLERLADSLSRGLPSGKAVKRRLYDTLSSSRRIRPAFADAWLMMEAPPGAEVVADYPLEGARVRLLNPADGSATLYWVVPDEYALPLAELALVKEAMAEVRLKGGRDVRSAALQDARRFVEEGALEFLRERLGVGAEGIEGLERARKLASVVARYTVGLGVLEHLLEDPRVTDVYSDAPCGAQPLYISVNLGDERVSDRLTTNITFAPEAVAALVTRARLEAGRPF